MKYLTNSLPGAIPFRTRPPGGTMQVLRKLDATRPDATPRPAHADDPFADLVRRQLALLGEDPERDGLLKTPERVARSMAWLTRGYGQTAEEVVGDALFEVEHESMVLVRDIEMYSLCEH